MSGSGRRSREYPRHPLVGVGALIHDEGGRVLLIRRKFEPNKGRWSLPGGLLETGESLEEGVLREVREELGIGVRLEGLIDVADEIIPDKDGRTRFHFILLDFLASPGDEKIVLNGESSAYRWFEPEKVVAPRMNSSEKTKALMRRYIRERRGKAGTGPTLR